MTTLYKTIFRLKRGNDNDWIENDPILEYGEPGFALQS
jgi:hypothetical protein